MVEISTIGKRKTNNEYPPVKMKPYSPENITLTRDEYEAKNRKWKEYQAKKEALDKEFASGEDIDPVTVNEHNGDQPEKKKMGRPKKVV